MCHPWWIRSWLAVRAAPGCRFAQYEKHERERETINVTGIGTVTQQQYAGLPVGHASDTQALLVPSLEVVNWVGRFTVCQAWST